VDGTAMSGWVRGDTWGGRACYRREVGGDRIMAYVAFDLIDPELDGDRTLPYSYHWSVQDGSCGRVIEQGSIDGDDGLETAQLAADEAAARLFPELAGD
jgi:hypothetical protein